MKNILHTLHGPLTLPAFMPDATYGAIKSINFSDAQATGTPALVTTTLHLEQKIGSTYLKQFGGIHRFFNWEKPILSDSGGWQVFSLINAKKDKTQNTITEVGCSFVDPATGNYSLLTPESSQTIQYNIGSDIVTVLDDPIIGDSSLSQRKESVRINTAWAKRSKDKFMQLHTINEQDYSASSKNRPLLGAVVQGGDDFKLRKQSVEELVSIGFDLYNFGGVPLLSKVSWRNDYPEGFHREMLHYVSELLPKDSLKYAMGVGQPTDIAFCVEHGWHLFDTVLPTRNARHGYIYVTEGAGDKQVSYTSSKSGKTYAYDVVHIRTERYKFDKEPVDPFCTCECCKTVSRAYLRHLIRIKEPAGFRLATIHNLHFYQKWMESLTRKKEVPT